jgi:hypothetical protein
MASGPVLQLEELVEVAQRRASRWQRRDISALRVVRECERS